MKKCILICALFFCLSGVVPASAQASNPTTLASYFASKDTGVLTGGVTVIPIETPKGIFNVWTKRFGNHPTIKLLLLNGGPGATHEYFECMESFLPKEGIEFIYYDQLGCGNSQNPGDTALWDLQRYVNEVEQVRTSLHLDKNNFFLLGHSWGGILALEYALQYPQNLKGVIVSNMMASAPDYDKYADEVLAKQMDAAVLDTIRRLEAAGDFTNPKYMELLYPHFYEKHICRIPLEKWPEPLTRSMGKINPSLYITMQGPSEFGLSGKLENWDVTKRLHTIAVPTLVIGAKYDTMDPAHMQWMSRQVQNGSYLYCPNGSHMSMYDDQEIYMQGLMKFLKGVDGGKKKAIL